MVYEDERVDPYLVSPEAYDLWTGTEYPDEGPM